MSFLKAHQHSEIDVLDWASVTTPVSVKQRIENCNRLLPLTYQ